MRTDVKVGLICLFAIVLAVVIYFVAQGNAHPRDAKADAAAVSTGTPAKPKAADADKSLSAPLSAPVIAPPTPAASSTPAAGDSHATADGSIPSKTGSPTLLAQGPTPGSTPMGGGIIPAPSAPSAAPLGVSPASPSPAPVAPPLYGGVPGGMSPTTTMPAGTPSFGGPGSSPMASPGYNRTDLPSSNNLGTGSPGMGGGRTGRPYGGGSGGVGSGGLGGYAIPSDIPMGSRTPAAVNTSSGNSNRTGSTYKIEKGDMLGTIAKKLGVTVAAIEKANPGIDSNHLKINAVINIPAATASTPSSHSTTTTVTVDKPATTKPSSKATDSSKTAKAPTGSGKIAPGSTYTVKKGDTLGNIAEAAYGDRKAWQRIYRANRGELDDANTITVGTVLRIPI